MMITRFRKNYWITALVFLAAFPCAGGLAMADGASHYKFGVFPFMPMAALIKYYNSVSQDFTRKINKRVIAQSRPTFRLFSEEIEKETYDIIFIQPFDYPKAYKHGYRPLARRADNLDAIIVTKIDGEVNTLMDLAGKILAFPPKESAISMVILRELKKSGLKENSGTEMIYTGNHFACMQMVLVDKADACSTTSPVLKRWENTQLKKKKLRVIHQSDGVPHALYMAHNRVPEDQQARLRDAILTWDKRSAGKSILKTFGVTNFVVAHDEDYDVIRNFWD